MFMAELDEKSRLRTAREEGLSEGKAEQAKEIARKMLSRKMDIPDIADITGLSPTQIEQLM